MNVEVFVLCDSANELKGKLSINGVFEGYNSSKFPYICPAFTVAIRLRYTHLEVGKHKLKILILDEDGKEVVSPITCDFSIKMPGNISTGTGNFLPTLKGILFPKQGEYSVHLEIDGEEKGSLPLYITQLKNS
jgi:hypothetical protein